MIELTKEQLDLLRAHGHRKVKSIMAANTPELHNLICDIAAGENCREWELQPYTNLLAWLDTVKDRLEDFVEANHEAAVKACREEMELVVDNPEPLQMGLLS